MTETPDRRRDRADIRALVAGLETAFNAKDAESIAAAFADDGWEVTVTGARRTGRAELLATHRAALAGGLRDQYARYEVLSVTFPAERVALAQVHAVATDRAGSHLDVGHTVLSLYVLVHGQGRWRVAARQATLVAA